MALCRPCHQHWGHGAGRPEYKARVIELLGTEGYKDMELRSNTTFKLPEKAILIYVRDLMRQLSDRNYGVQWYEPTEPIDSP